MIFGIVGYGRFGQLWANALIPFGNVRIFDKTIISNSNDSIKNDFIKNNSIKISKLQEVAQADIVFIIVPISAFETACLEIKNYIKSDTLIVDCCSVKLHPANIMQKIFSTHQPLIATHPLFGPDSVKKTGGMANHKMVVCPVQSDEILLNTLLNLFNQMKLDVLITTPENHDRQMASSQSLVHFIGRGLAALELEEQTLSTPDFQALLNINKMVVNDTWQLFLDMHQYNPFAKKIRERFLQQLNTINNEVNRANH